MQAIFRNYQQLTAGKWLTSSISSFFVILFSLLIIMMVLNVGLANNINFPILNTLPIFSVMFEQNAWETLIIFSNKTLISIGQFDPRSGLYLWTLELNFNSLLAYFIAAIIATPLLRAASIDRAGNQSTLAWALTGLLMLVFSRTYVTVLEHCAGPTWIGYVSLYALGAENLQLTSTWQWAFTVTAGLLISVAIIKTYSSKKYI